MNNCGFSGRSRFYACRGQSTKYSHHYDDITVFSRILAQSRFISRRHIRDTHTHGQTELGVRAMISCPSCNQRTNNRRMINQRTMALRSALEKKEIKKAVESQHQSTAQPHQSANNAYERAAIHIKVTHPSCCPPWENANISMNLISTT